MTFGNVNPARRSDLGLAHELGMISSPGYFALPCIYHYCPRDLKLTPEGMQVLTIASTPYWA
jgi:hypothetical protein